jgi:GT2 family glycosyltransferase
VKIAVVIVNFNSGDMLANCIDHLLCQTRPADTIVVIDNASQDDSLAGLPNKPELHVYKLEKNEGFATANNIAFHKINTADYFITLNPDAFASPDFIEQFEIAATQSPQYSSFASRMMVNDELVDGAGDTYHLSGLAWRNLHDKQYFPAEHQRRDVFSPCAGAAMYRARDIFEMNGFDDAFFCYMEDVDLGYRMQLKGKRCLYVPDATVVHIGSAIVSQYPGFSLYYGHRNLVWVLVKNTPGPLLPIVLPAHLAMSALLSIVYLLRGQLKVYLRAKGDALRGLPHAWHQRRNIQQSREISSWKVLKFLDFSLKR